MVQEDLLGGLLVPIVLWPVAAAFLALNLSVLARFRLCYKLKRRRDAEIAWAEVTGKVAFSIGGKNGGMQYMVSYIFEAQQSDGREVVVEVGSQQVPACIYNTIKQGATVQVVYPRGNLEANMLDEVVQAGQVPGIDIKWAGVICMLSGCVVLLAVCWASVMVWKTSNHGIWIPVAVLSVWLLALIPICRWACTTDSMLTWWNGDSDTHITPKEESHSISKAGQDQSLATVTPADVNVLLHGPLQTIPEDRELPV